MHGFLGFFAFRTIIIFISTAFAIAVVMLALNIITVEDLLTILGLEPNSPQANAIKHVISRFQEVTGNVLKIISQLLNKTLSWAGVDVDLTKIRVDTQSTPLDPNAAASSGAAAPLQDAPSAPAANPSK